MSETPSPKEGEIITSATAGKLPIFPDQLFPTFVFFAPRLHRPILNSQLIQVSGKSGGNHVIILDLYSAMRFRKEKNRTRAIGMI